MNQIIKMKKRKWNKKIKDQSHRYSVNLKIAVNGMHLKQV